MPANEDIKIEKLTDQDVQETLQPREHEPISCRKVLPRKGKRSYVQGRSVDMTIKSRVNGSRAGTCQGFRNQYFFSVVLLVEMQK